MLMMTLHNGESIWKLLFGLGVAVIFLCVGIGHVINPDYFIQRSAVRKGGELLTESNRIGFQFVGMIATIFAGFMIYILVGDMLGK
jgi:hypothetical protein